MIANNNQISITLPNSNNSGWQKDRLGNARKKRRRRRMRSWRKQSVLMPPYPSIASNNCRIT
jgi:hypothetical protein